MRIADDRPDYSGVGGIASDRQRLWLIIAFYAYVSKTHDLDFLRHYFDPAADGNGLACAPTTATTTPCSKYPKRATGPTSLAAATTCSMTKYSGIACNVCFGRLLQLLGDEQRAGDYLRWARVIKREILANFWPTTQQSIYQSVSFAEQQFSIGDARYLIAQITPFDFSWRCDTFGNILAFPV